MKEPAPPNIEMCSGNNPAPQNGFSSNVCSSDAATVDDRLGPEDSQEDATTSGTQSLAPGNDKKDSDAVRMLDEELAELENLLVLQGKKLDVLQRVRQQWLSGQRSLPENLPPRHVVSAFVGSVTEPALMPEYPMHPWDPVASIGRFEHHMIPYARVPLTSPLFDMEMLSFRLKYASRTSGGSGKQGAAKRAGYLTVLACLHADGVVRLHDTDGEEVLAFDSGHTHKGAWVPSSPSSERSNAVGLFVDASESNPVLITAGDGSLRVHALKVYLRGKRVAGGNRDGGKGSSRGVEKANSKGRSSKHSRMVSTTSDPAEGSSGDERRTKTEVESSSGSRRRDSRDGSSLAPPPATAIGIAISSEFRVCLGPTCGDRSLGEETSIAGSEEYAQDDSTKEEDTKPPGSFPQAALTYITSVDVFYHRAMSTTVIIAGYSAGGVRFFHGDNGTALGSADADGTVLAVKRSGQSIAYSDGRDVRFVNVAKLERTPDRVCRGDSGAMVTSLAFDISSPGTLYVGYDTGAVMAFNSKLKEVDGSFRCLPAYLVGSQASGLDEDGSEGRENNRISTVRGYALVTRGPLLSVFNITEEARLLFSRPIDGDGDDTCRTGGSPDDTEDSSSSDGSHLLAPRWRVMSSTASGEALVVETGRCAEEIVVYKAILPYERHGQDIAWMRLPILLFGILIVAVTQVYMRKGTKSGSSNNSRRTKRAVRFGDGDAPIGDSDPRNFRRELASTVSRSGLGGWDRSGPDSRGNTSSRMPPPSRRYGDPWEQGSSD